MKHPRARPHRRGNAASDQRLRRAGDEVPTRRGISRRHQEDDRADEYVKAHRDDPPDAAAEARRHRTARMKRDRIAKHNAPIMRRIEKQERKGGG